MKLAPACAQTRALPKSMLGPRVCLVQACLAPEFAGRRMPLAQRVRLAQACIWPKRAPGRRGACFESARLPTREAKGSGKMGRWPPAWGMQGPRAARGRPLRIAFGWGRGAVLGSVEQTPAAANWHGGAGGGQTRRRTHLRVTRRVMRSYSQSAQGWRDPPRFPIPGLAELSPVRKRARSAP